ncbi:uncharacterized protein EDB91DRAFT_1250009 [Suillus paluster]|uniref:uncharacterized protein n=1 Tax=Suillus paluster TaxID=48578 RepID=UPI001B878082|nr:uncharacterized protein EDB91DRAFT_1250009 [Suillus paluster]KAG1736396.1 hypothetical protein EDB91DRAFT_1250009 [Suillus paluster]
MMSTSTSGILPTVSSSSAFPTCRLQPCMDNLLQNDLVGNVLWEETDLPATTSSLMDHIIPKSSIRRPVIENITYATGVLIFVDHKWQLDKHQNKQMLKQKQKQAPDDTDSDTEELGTDCEGSSVSGQEGSSASAAPDASDQGWDSQEYDPNQPNRKPTPKQTPEQKWVCLFNTVYTAMRMTYRAMFPHHSPMYPFEPADHKRPHQQWSPEFCNAPIPDVTNIQKPDVVLLDRDVQPKSWAHVLTCIEITESDLGTNHDIPLFKGVITKGYLMMREQPWRRFIMLFSLAANHLRAHYMDHSGLIITRPILITANPMRLVDMLNTMSLGNNKSHGMDPTIHMCNKSCKQTQCEVGDQAIGWIEDKEKQKLLIIAILWRSQGLFSHGTICYHVWDKDGVEYALKDCWVDEAKKDHEEKVLEMVRGIPNVVTLIATWDVEYEGEPDSTLRIHNRHRKFSPEFRCKYHQRMLLTPCGEPLSTFSTKRELISAFRDLVVTHKAMTERKVLHRDLSPNNLIIYKGCGFFIDFDHAQIIVQCNISVRAWGTISSSSKGTSPYMSICLLRYLHSASKLTDKDLVMMGQTASDDLESLFYIFVEFVTTYDGLHGKIIYPKTEQWADLLEDIGSRAVSYKSGLLLVKRDEELMNCTMAYFGQLKYLVQEWHLKFLQAVEESCESGIHHKDIEEGPREMDIS